jgi:histidine triad (HIT) family protein
LRFRIWQWGTATNCVFCDIIHHKVPAEILYENADAMAILDIRPIHLGHALIIPKCHCGTFVDVPPSSVNGIMDATRRVAEAMVQSLQLEGFNIFSNNGAIAGQSVFHFHWHVTPRYKNDNIRFELKLKQYSDGEMAMYGQRIRESINRTV